MGLPNLEPLRESMTERIRELEEKKEEMEERYDGDGSTPVVWEKIEPKMKRKVVEDCLEDLNQVEELEDLLKVIADWRNQKNDEWKSKTNLSTNEHERRKIKRLEIEGWLDNLIGRIPEEKASSCAFCGEEELPKVDQRYGSGFRWACPNCS